MNYWGVLLGLLICPLLASAQESASLRELPLPPIGYTSVQDAYDSLSADETASKSEHEGWTLFTQKVDTTYILWSFTPQDHPVHPSAVRRDIVKKDGEILISMSAMCYSSRQDCDQLIAQFRQINEGLKQRFADAPD